MPIVEEAEFDVTLTITLGTRIVFSPIDRETEISKSDAVNNAIGSIPNSVLSAVLSALEGEGFSIAYPIDGSAEEIYRQRQRG